MNLPGFTGVRAPARFAMLAILALSVAAALAFDRLRLRPDRRRVIAAAAIVGILVDGWAAPLALAAVPDMWPWPADYSFGPVLELPLMTDYGDFVAMVQDYPTSPPVHQRSQWILCTALPCPAVCSRTG